MAIALLNAYMDPAEGMTLLVHTAGDVMRITDMRGSQSEVEAAGADGPYKEFVLPTIAPWEMLLAVG